MRRLRPCPCSPAPGLDLARQVNQTSNRIRGPCAPRPRPALEKILGPWLEHDAVLQVIATWPTPTALRRARVDATLKAHGARRHTTWASAIIDALDAQSVVVAGTDAAGVVLPHLARQLIALHAQRRDVATQVEALVEAHPHVPGPDHPCPASGSRPPPCCVAETLGRSFASGAHLASYAGLTPVTRRSGSSIRGEYTSHAGNKRLKRAMFLSAFASLRSDPVSRADSRPQDRTGQSALGQALIALAHRRILTLHAMIRDGALYDPQPAHQLPTAA